MLSLLPPQEMLLTSVHLPRGWPKGVLVPEAASQKVLVDLSPCSYGPIGISCFLWSWGWFSSGRYWWPLQGFTMNILLEDLNRLREDIFLRLFNAILKGLWGAGGSLDLACLCKLCKLKAILYFCWALVLLKNTFIFRMHSEVLISQLKVLWGVSSVPVPPSQLPLASCASPWGFPRSLTGCCVRTVVASVVFHASWKLYA